jgi:hypothetical protein
MPRSTALTHFLTARAPEPYRIGPVLLTTQGEGTPSDAGHGLMLVVDRGVIHLITPAASSGTPRALCTRPCPGVGGHRWTMTHSLRIGCVAVLRCCAAQLGYPSTYACAGDSSCASTRGCIPSVSVGVTAKTDLVVLLGLGVSRCSQLCNRSRHLNGLGTSGIVRPAGCCSKVSCPTFNTIPRARYTAVSVREPIPFTFGIPTKPAADICCCPSSSLIESVDTARPPMFFCWCRAGDPGRPV